MSSSMRLEVARLKRAAKEGGGKYAFCLYVVTPSGAEVLLDGTCSKTEGDGMLEIASSAIGATPPGALASVSIQALGK